MAEEKFGDQATVELLQAANEPEARGIESLLREEGIECAVVSFADRAYPGILDRERTWGAIRVAKPDLERAAQLVEAWRNATPVESDMPAADPSPLPAKRRGAALAQTFLLLCSLGTNVYLYVTYVTPSIPAQVEYRDPDGRLIARYAYRPSAQLPYETRSYDTRGRLTSTALDRDENGWMERWSSHHGTDVRIDHLDEGQDGTYEVAKAYREQQLIGIDRDDDQDGLFERSSDLDEQGRERSHTIDRDKDGYPDEVHCTPGSDPVTFDLDTCGVR